MFQVSITKENISTTCSDILNLHFFLNISQDYQSMLKSILKNKFGNNYFLLTSKISVVGIGGKYLVRTGRLGHSKVELAWTGVVRVTVITSSLYHRRKAIPLIWCEHVVK